MDLYAEILQASWSDAFRMTAAGEGGSSGAGRFGERFKRSETRRTSMAHLEIRLSEAIARSK
jgi:hypothetical protein